MSEYIPGTPIFGYEMHDGKIRDHTRAENAAELAALNLRVNNHYITVNKSFVHGDVIQALKQKSKEMGIEYIVSSIYNGKKYKDYLIHIDVYDAYVGA